MSYKLKWETVNKEIVCREGVKLCEISLFRNWFTTALLLIRDHYNFCRKWIEHSFQSFCKCCPAYMSSNILFFFTSCCLSVTDSIVSQTNKQTGRK